MFITMFTLLEACAEFVAAVQCFLNNYVATFGIKLYVEGLVSLCFLKIQNHPKLTLLWHITEMNEVLLLVYELKARI